MNKEVKEIVEKGLRFLKSTRYTFLPVPQSFLHKNIQYYSQWVSPELVDRFLSRKLSAKDDPKWKQSGAKTREEYELWSWNICGMACLKMVLQHSNQKDIPLIPLAKKCEQYGGYIEKQSYPKKIEPWKRIDGLFYKPLVPFLQQEFGIHCDIKQILVLPEIIHSVSKENYVIVSVDPAIRDPKSISKQKGGHLVLITGYDKKKRVLYLHNPSGYYKKSQKYAEISFTDFKRFFAYKGFIISRL